MWSEARLVWAITGEELHLGSFGNRDPAKLRDTSQSETPKVSLYVIYTWSMAQGIRHWISMSSLSPNIAGNVVLKDGAAWTAGKLYIPAMKRKHC